MRFLILVLAVCLAACDSTDVLGPGGQQEGVVSNGSIELHYVLDFPEGEGPYPAVIYGPGSGDISAQAGSIVAHTRELLDLGFAVMRYDKRGTGESDGEVVGVSRDNSLQTIPLLASDMQAVVQQLLQEPEINTSQVGLFGASQASWYMPLVAEQMADIQFMIVLTGGVIAVGPKNFWEELVFVRDLDQESALMQWNQFDGDLGFDPKPHIENLNISMLYLWGERDPGSPPMVTLNQLDQLIEAGSDIDVVSYNDGIHLLDGIDFWPDVAQWLRSKGYGEL